MLLNDAIIIYPANRDIGGRESGWYEDVLVIEKNSLCSMFVVYALSLFESYIKEEILRAFKARPEVLKSFGNKTVTVNEIIENIQHPTVDILAENIANDIVKIIYNVIEEIFTKRLKINFEDEILAFKKGEDYCSDMILSIDKNKYINGCRETLIENIERRNIIVHNNSKIDKKYMIITSTPLDIGIRLIPDYKYCFDLTCRLILIMTEISTILGAKFYKP